MTVRVLIVDDEPIARRRLRTLLHAESSVEIVGESEDGESAVRVRVALGRASVNAIEVIEGLVEGDRVVLSDMATWQNEERIKLK